MSSPDPVALVEEAVPACKYRGYIAVALRSVPHAGNRLWLAKWVVHRFRNVGGKTSSIYRSLHGPTYYLQGLGETSIEAATLEEFQSIWITAIHAPTRTFEHCRKGPLTPRTRREYQRECQRFLEWALGAEQAAAKASFMPSALDGPDPVSRTVPWEKLDEVRAMLSGMNLAYFILLTASGLSTGEIRTLPVDALTYEGPMCLIQCPPTRSFPQGRVVALHHGDEVLAAYQAMIRRDNPKQRLLFPQKKHLDRPLNREDLWVRVRKWGLRVGIAGLEAQDLRLTYLCYLLSRDDVGEHYVMHAMGVIKGDNVRELKRAVETAKLTGHDFGHPLAHRRGPSPGHRPCTACGKLDNPVGAQHKVCSGCGTPFGDRAPTQATYILADLADAVRRLRDITGETRNDRAEAALAQLERDERRRR